MASGDKSADTNLLTVKDVAERLNVSASLIYQLVDTGERRFSSIFCLNRDGDAWKQSTRFGRDDLPLVAKTTDLAHSWISREFAGQKADQKLLMRRVKSPVALMESTFHQLFGRTQF